MAGELQFDQDEPRSHALRLALRSMLEDLRLMIDSLDEACADLSVALAMLRMRLAPLMDGLAAKGTASGNAAGGTVTGAPRLVWETAHLPDLPSVAPGHVLAVLRIVQEAITNALKHAQASQICIAARWHAPELEICIADDGVGLLTQSVHYPGRGLPSMQRRSAEINAKLDIVANLPSGTQVRLRMRIT